MTVYVVTYDTGDDANDFSGVFSTEEKAQQYINKFKDGYGGERGLYIEPHELDEAL
jgi:hypothetical protein